MRRGQRSARRCHFDCTKCSKHLTSASDWFIQRRDSHETTATATRLGSRRRRRRTLRRSSAPRCESRPLRSGSRLRQRTMRELPPEAEASLDHVLADPSRVSHHHSESTGWHPSPVRSADPRSTGADVQVADDGCCFEHELCVGAPARRGLSARSARRARWLVRRAVVARRTHLDLSIDPAGTRRGSRSRATGLVLLGALCGLAWSAGLRGFMAEVAAEESSVDWGDTFGWILLPGLVGMLLGWLPAWVGRRQGMAVARAFTAPVLGHRAQSPSRPVVDLRGWSGRRRDRGLALWHRRGYAASGRGPLWARVVSGLVALTVIPGWALTVTSFAGPELALSTPRCAWVALYYFSFILILMLACSIPFRALTRR
jgi:hypothetical protein